MTHLKLLARSGRNLHDIVAQLPAKQSGHVFAIADIAASVFAKELRIRPGEARILRISDGMADMPDHMICNLPRLLEFGPIGIALFDRDERRWFIV